MKYIKCDRCGKIVEATESFILDSYLGYCREDHKYSDDERFEVDLCYECYKKVEDFIFEGEE